MREIPDIDPDITRARTLPGWFYGDAAVHQAMADRVFRDAFHPLPGAAVPDARASAIPFTLLPGLLDEPLVASRDEAGVLRVLSNVCTHRGNLIVLGGGSSKSLSCGYHGRRFGLDGLCVSMPEFEAVEGFPSDSDHLPRYPVGDLGALSFTCIGTAGDLDTWLRPVKERVGFLPLGELRYDAPTSTSYTFDASWALYCDNYLEGFHIPFVHPELSRTLRFRDYRTELFASGTLQIGVGAEGEPAFVLPGGHPDAGARVAAYYFWLFPNTMLNFYPWGLSLNVVEPLTATRTRVRFESWVLDPSLRDRGAGAALDLVEQQDEAIVQRVQKGVRARAYHRGRYSPTQERGVHHFHRLLSRALR